MVEEMGESIIESLRKDEHAAMTSTKVVVRHPLNGGYCDTSIQQCRHNNADCFKVTIGESVKDEVPDEKIMQIYAKYQGTAQEIVENTVKRCIASETGLADANAIMEICVIATDNRMKFMEIFNEEPNKTIWTRIVENQSELTENLREAIGISTSVLGVEMLSR